MSLVNFAPVFTLTDARKMAKELYGLSGTVETLPSERDQNFLMTSDLGEQYVLKIANATEEIAMLEAQNQVMEHVVKQEQLLPNVLPSLRGEKIAKIPGQQERTNDVRLVTYLPGIPMGKVKRHSPQLMFDLGQKLARLDHALQGFDHPALHRDFHWDYANGLTVINKNAKLIKDKKLRDMVLVLAKSFEKYTAPLLPRLRKSIIYNDANDYNILLGGGEDIFSRNQTVTGFIDLGDMVHGVAESGGAVRTKPCRRIVVADVGMFRRMFEKRLDAFER